MLHTYELIKIDQELQNQNWDPWTHLEMEIPSGFNMWDGFDTPEVK